MWINEARDLDTRPRLSHCPLPSMWLGPRTEGHFKWMVLGVWGHGGGRVSARRCRLGEVAHGHIWWHYFITKEGLVWDSPDKSPPENLIQEGYACPSCRREVQARLAPPKGGAS